MQCCPNPNCKKRVGGKLKVCPECGTSIRRLGRVGRYDLLECVADTSTSSIYRARRDGDSDVVCLRLYDDDVIFSPEEERLLRQRFEALRELPAERFAHTLDFGRDDTTGRWYRVTPWLPDVKAWGDLKSESLYRNPERKRQWLGLARDLAESFAELHRIGRVIPDFTLDDCLLYRTPEDRLRVRLDATLASCLGPGSGREKARDRHPDFAPGRALSEQSDVWALGSLFVEMLKGTSEIADFPKAMDEINAERRPVAIHPNLGALLRQMVDADPAERPRNMKSVSERLHEFGPREISEWGLLDNPHLAVLRRIGLVAAAAVVVAVGLTAIQMRRQSRQLDERIEDVRRQATGLILDGQGYVDARTADTVKGVLEHIRRADSEHRVQVVLERYARSVAFLLAEVWIETAAGRIFIPELSVTGTAFLVTSDGYLLSNRHVVAPWTTYGGAKDLNEQVLKFRRDGNPFRFGVTHYLWFDGDEAFRHRHMAFGDQTADRYRLDTAYSSDCEQKRVEVVGVMPKPSDPAEYFASTHEDDVAVLKIAVLPEGAVPIPLRAGAPPRRGAGVLALGYSLGRSAIPGTRAVARCSRGAVTALPGDVITVDADMHRGNSGGPVLDWDGYAIGLATQLFAAQTGMGTVLPIATAQAFLERVSAETPVWNGLPEVAFEPEVRAAIQAVNRGDWAGAASLSTVLGIAGQPDVAVLAAVLSLETDGFSAQGRDLLERVVKMAPHSPFPALLRYWDAWRHGAPAQQRPHRKAFLEAPWHSPFEGFSPIVHLLEDGVSLEAAEARAESPAELALLFWAAGTSAARAGNRERAAELLHEGFSVAPREDILLRRLLAASLWHECGQRPGKDARSARPAASTPGDDTEVAAFIRALREHLRQETAEPANRIADPSRRFEHVSGAFNALANGDWPAAARAAEAYFQSQRRESANSLRMGLLRAQLDGLIGGHGSERHALEQFRDSIENAWYKKIAEALLDHLDAASLLASVAGRRPETLTLSLALGLQAEARGDKPVALDRYRTALDTGQVNWLEFQLARARRQALGAM